MQFALYALFRTEGHIVAQIVKTVFVVGTVSNIGCVGFTLGRRRQAGHVNPNGHPQEFKQGAVVLRITLRQIIVDGDHVNAFAGQRIQIGRQRCGQRFTFTGTHFCNTAVVENHAAQQLNVKVTHAEDAFTGFTHDGKGFRDQALQGFAFFQASAELSGFPFQFVVGQFFHGRFHGVDHVDGFAHTTQRTVVTTTEYFS